MKMSDQLHAPAALLPRQELRYSLDGSVDCPQNRSGRFGEEKNSLDCVWIRTPDRPVHSSVITRTMLSWLLIRYPA